MVSAAGQDFTCLDFRGMPHSMHGHQPELYADTVIDWAAKLPTASDH